MTQTLALLLDAYRELNAKKLFWITMAISGLVVLIFAGFGINEKGLTLLHWQFDTPLFTSRLVPPEKFYKFSYATFAVPFWLTWIANILALVSTSSIFPDFIAGGAVELTLSKPISRTRLYLTKYATGLLFAALQVAVFSVACFVVIGLRAHSWEPRTFLAVPIVVLIFSYLFSMCTLLGLVTRSTITALLLTLLLWFMLWGVNTTDVVFLRLRETAAVNAERAAKRLERAQAAATKQIETMREKGAPTPAQQGLPPQCADELEAVNPFLKGIRDDARDSAESAARWKRLSSFIVAAKTLLPKTAETSELLDRWLLTPEDKQIITGRGRGEGDVETKARFDNQDPEVERLMEDAVRGRTVGWIIGTSLGFEAVVLALGAWLFARRDF